MPFPYAVVAVTGASSGLGAEMARQVAREGARVALLARRAQALGALAEEIRGAGGTAVAVPCDVDDADAVRAAMARVERELGPVDCMIANAGIGQPDAADPWDPSVPDRVLRTNVMGMVHALYAVAPDMVRRGRGHLVGVSSMASYQGLPGDGGYAASKAAQRILLEGLRVQLRGTGVRVTCLCPGFVRTPLTDRNDFDMPFLLEPDVACRRMLNAVARGRRVFNFPRPMALLVWFGQRAPRWLYDRFVARASGRRGRRTQPLSTRG